MQLTINRDSLLAALELTRRTATPAARTALPVLACALLDATDGALRISSTNLEQHTRVTTPASVTDAGRVAVPHALLRELVATLPPACTVALHVDAGATSMRVNAGAHDVTLRTLDAADFPLTSDDAPLLRTDGAPDVMPTSPDVASVALDAAAFARALTCAAVCAAVDESRPVLRTVCVTLRNSSVTCAATDGFRLTTVRTDAPACAADVTMLLPLSAVGAITHAIGATGASTCALSASPTRATFALDGTPRVVIATQLVEGRFPDYQAIIPKASTTTVTVDRALLVEAVKLAYLFAREAANIVRFSVYCDSIGVEATSAEHGDGHSGMKCEVEGHEPMEIAFNGRYVLDALAAMTTPDVSLAFTVAARPGVLRPAGDDGMLTVLMPMAIKG